MFFVFGMPRSGTTLMAQCLSAHSQLVIPHETDFIVPMAFVFDRIRDPEVGRDLIYRLIVNSGYFPQSLAEYLTWDDVRAAVYRADYHPRSVLEEVYGAVARRAGAALAGDKSPNDIGFLRILVKSGTIDAGSKIVHVVRDARDMMVSLRRTGWLPDGDAYFPRMWANANLYLWTLFSSSRENYVLVRYEDLVTDPRDALARVCSVLGVPYEVGMLSPDRRHLRYKGADVHSKLYDSITSDSVGAYRNELDAGTIASYERQAREALEIFGYLGDGLGPPASRRAE